MPVTIKTNNQWRDLVYRHDVPAKVLADQFDYQDAEEVLDGFFHYHGEWYHLDQFMHSDNPALATGKALPVTVFSLALSSSFPRTVNKSK